MNNPEKDTFPHKHVGCDRKEQSAPLGDTFSSRDNQLGNCRAISEENKNRENRLGARRANQADDKNPEIQLGNCRAIFEDLESKEWQSKKDTAEPCECDDSEGKTFRVAPDDLLIASLFSMIPSELAPLFEGIKYPWQVLPLIGEFIKDRLPKTGLREIFTDVFVAEDVKIAQTAHISGPTVILSGAEIRHGAFIRGKAFIGRGCVVGNSTEVKNSLLFDGAQVPHYNYVGDSILGVKAHLGAGTITSNLKSLGGSVAICAEDKIETGLRKLGAILGDRADVGSGCVLNPGTVIGRGSVVYPLTSVRGVVPANVIVKKAGVFTPKIGEHL